MKIKPDQSQAFESRKVVHTATDAAIIDTLLDALRTDSDITNEASIIDQDSYLDDFQNRLPKFESSLKSGQKIGKWKILSMNYYHGMGKTPHLLVRCECGLIKAKSESAIKAGIYHTCDYDK